MYLGSEHVYTDMLILYSSNLGSTTASAAPVSVVDPLPKSKGTSIGRVVSFGQAPCAIFQLVKLSMLIG